VFNADAVKVDRDVTYVTIIVHVCCKCLFPMFHLFFSDVCYKCVYLNITYVSHILPLFQIISHFDFFIHAFTMYLNIILYLNA
jgi:hypothetical protein